MSLKALTGLLAGPVVGIRYETPTFQGLTNENGEFQYTNGERVAFLLGATAIGNVIAAPRIHLAQIVSRVDGNISKLKDPGLTNIARLVFTLDRTGARDEGTHMSPEVHEIIGERALDFRHEVYFGANHEDLEEAFATDAVVVELLHDLNRADVFTDRVPRQLCSPANARNELRRNAMGILRFRDVKIPLQNGLYVLADVFRPSKPGNYPVIMNCGVYGKAFHHHSIANDLDLEKHEQMEEDYFLGNSQGLVYENHETVNTAEWVPNGYAVMRVDGPGTGKSPGKLAIWGYSTAQAFHDAIEWAGVQAWSNGNVGLWGMSYYAVTQQAVASLRPLHLKAMVSIGTDVDLYEEIAYNGGIRNEGFFPFWYKMAIRPAVCGEPDLVDFIQIIKDSPFKDSNLQAVFGPKSEVFMSPDMSKVTTPAWIVSVTTHQFNFHQLGSSEAYLHTSTSNKRLDFCEDWFTRSYASATVAEHRKFYDYWLKGIDNGIMATPPIRLEIRTGNGASFMQEEHEWPIARTEYPVWYFDATPHRSVDGLRLSTERHTGTGEVSYSADVLPKDAVPTNPGPFSRFMDRHTTGVTFLSDPLPEDAMLAGYGKVKLWVSSTTDDMDIYVSVRVLDDQNGEVDYCGPTYMSFPDRIKPVMKGWLKVSHRKIDEARSTRYTVKHTHLKADYAPLKPGEVVPVEIELSPNMAMLRKGHRIRVDVQPHDGVAHGLAPHEYDGSYHDGAVNRIHTGPDHVGTVQLPIVPLRQ